MMVLKGQMSENTKLLVQLLVEFLYGKPSLTKVTPPEVPTETQAVVKRWAESLSLPIDDSDTSVTITLINDRGSKVYVYDYSGDNPDLFRGVCVVEGGTILGESIDVGS